MRRITHSNRVGRGERLTDTKNAVGLVGLGYVGLSTAVCFASRGIPTLGIDMDENKLRDIALGKSPFVEKGVEGLLTESLKKRNLRITSDFGSLTDAQVIFITVGTPSSRDGSVSLRHVESAAGSIGRAIRHEDDYKLVVVKSTVTPGTTGNAARRVLESESRKKLGEFGLASNPEFLREGHAIEDTMNPSRLVIGATDKKSERTLVSFYRRFYGMLPKTVRTTPVNAELIKYASNSFLATKVTFINEIANLCAALPGADVSVVAKGMGLDSRIAPHYLRAGLGYGGSCLPKDTRALLKLAAKVRVKLGVAAAAYEGNRRQARIAVELAENLIGDLGGKRIALLGLAFKPDSDDMREAVSLRLIYEFKKRRAEIVAYDPVALPNAKRILGKQARYRDSALECLKGADCCVIVTECAEFSRLEPVEFKALMRVPAIVDGRRVLDPRPFTQAGIKFAAVGLGSQADP